MSTMERTISMMEKLPEADLLKIHDLIRELFLQHVYEAADNAVGKAFKLMSKEDFMEDIEAAEKDIEGGRCKRVEEVFDGLERRYGF